MVHLLYKFLKKANCISILIIDQPWGTFSLGEGISEFLADGIIYLETYFDENEMLSRRLKILKMRGTNNTKLPYSYDINSNGFSLVKVKAIKSKVRERK